MLKNSSRKKKILFIIFFVFLSIILILVASYGVMRYTGKKSLMKNNKIPTLSTLPQYADETEDDNSDTDYSVRYNGKKYKYDETMINLLFIGTDNEDEVRKNEFFGNGGQADVLLLACVNTEKNSVKIISIPRDTLCNVELFDYWGNSLGSKELQIALSYAYGDGEKKSCEITANAVSDLLYGLPVHA